MVLFPKWINGVIQLINSFPMKDVCSNGWVFREYFPIRVFAFKFMWLIIVIRSRLEVRRDFSGRLKV